VTPSTAATCRSSRRAPLILPPLNLDDALSIALLVNEHEPHNAERAALRWLGRWALESRQAGLAGLLEATVRHVGARTSRGKTEAHLPGKSACA